MSYSTFEKSSVSSKDRTLAMALWAISIFTAFIGPVVIWLLKKDESSFIDYNGKQYLNFIISYAIYNAIAFVLVFLLIGFLLVPIIWVLHLIFTIVAAVKAFDGQLYRVPFVFQIFR